MNEQQKPLAPAPPGSSKPIVPSQAGKSPRVSSACRMCRIRKSKCDGGAPCSKCITRKSQCIYENYDRRRERAALQHDFNRLTQTLRAHEELVNSLRTGDKRDIDDLISLLREHETIGDVVKQFQRRLSRVQSRPSFSGSQTGTEIGSEVGSEGTGDAVGRGGADVEMVSDTADSDTGANPLSATSTDAPTDWPGKFDPQDQSHVYGQRHDSLSGGPANTLPELGLAVSPRPDTHCSQTIAAYTVWPNPWTTVTEESWWLSHLMALCGTWSRPMYSFINLDLFVRDLLAGRADCKFCSPSLVNAVAALSCLICSHPEALADPLEHDSRGEHFTAEAKRHLNSSHKKNDLPSAQSLACLSIVEASRRRNTASWWYSALFFNMVLQLGLPSHNTRVVMAKEHEDESEMEKQQLGLAAASFAIFFMERIWFTFLKTSAPSNITDLPLATVSALQKSGNNHLIIGQRGAVDGASQSHHYTSHPAPAANQSLHPGVSYGKGKNEAMPQAATVSHTEYPPEDLDLNHMIKDMLSFMSTPWNYTSSRDLVALHEKLKTWLFS